MSKTRKPKEEKKLSAHEQNCEDCKRVLDIVEIDPEDRTLNQKNLANAFERFASEQRTLGNLKDEDDDE